LVYGNLATELPSRRALLCGARWCRRRGDRI